MRDHTNVSQAFARPTLVGGFRAFLGLERRGARPWGDGFANVGAATLWYRCGWDDISEDELVFLIPSLLNQTAAPSRRSRGLVEVVEAAVERKARALMSRLVETGWADAHAAAGLLRRCGVASPGTPRAALGQLPNVRPAGAASVPSCGGGGGTAKAALVYEICALVAMERMLAVARGDTRAGAASLPQVFTASLHACINGGYAYPDHRHLHELLSLAAWLGSLERHGAALLPAVIATTLRELVDEAAGDGADADAEMIRSIVRAHARAIGDARRASRKAIATGRARLVRLRSDWRDASLSPSPWDETLAKHVASCLSSPAPGRGDAHA
ncbi:MAG: hypothetical protein AB7E70_10430 [Hyphomicrobiaceae bacterium]